MISPVTAVPFGRKEEILEVSRIEGVPNCGPLPLFCRYFWRVHFGESHFEQIQ